MRFRCHTRSSTCVESTCGACDVSAEYCVGRIYNTSTACANACASSSYQLVLPLICFAISLVLLIVAILFALCKYNKRASRLSQHKGPSDIEPENLQLIF